MNKRNKLITLGIMGLILVGLMQYNKVLVFENLVSNDYNLLEAKVVNVITVEPESKVTVSDLKGEELEKIESFFNSNDYKRSYKGIKLDEIETDVPFYIELILENDEVLTVYSHGMVSFKNRNYRLYFEGYEKANVSQEALTELYNDLNIK